MILLYTGATSANAPQINANNSLGGYVSSSQIPNGRLANLFSTVAKSDVLQSRSQIRLIALKNTTGVTVNNVKVFSTVTDSHVKLQLAAVAPAIDPDNNPVYESVLDGTTLPYQAVLNYHEGVDNAIDVGSISNGATIGIWVLREIDQSKFPELHTDATGQALADLLNDSAAVADETITLSISWA